MKELPLGVRFLINIVFFILYVLFLSLVFSFVYPLVLDILWKEIQSFDNPIFAQIQIVIIVFVLFITLVFRKYFYISIKTETAEKEEDDKETSDEISWSNNESNNN